MQALPGTLLRGKRAAGAQGAGGGEDGGGGDGGDDGLSRLRAVVEELREEDDEQENGEGACADVPACCQAGLMLKTREAAAVDLTTRLALIERGFACCVCLAQNDTGDDGAEYSEDDAPPPGEELLEDEDANAAAMRGVAGDAAAASAAAASASSSGSAAANGGAAQAVAAATDFDNHPLRNLAWPLLITKEAIAGWGTLNDQWRCGCGAAGRGGRGGLGHVDRNLEPSGTPAANLTCHMLTTPAASWLLPPHCFPHRKLVMARLRVIGQGLWPRCRGAKRITSDDPLLMPQELWRLKLTKGGRILFEVAVDDHDSKGTFCEIIRVWVGLLLGGSCRGPACRVGCCL